MSNTENNMLNSSIKITLEMFNKTFDVQSFLNDDSNDTL